MRPVVTDCLWFASPQSLVSGSHQLNDNKGAPTCLERRSVGRRNVTKAAQAADGIRDAQFLAHEPCPRSPERGARRAAAIRAELTLMFGHPSASPPQKVRRLSAPPWGPPLKTAAFAWYRLALRAGQTPSARFVSMSKRSITMSLRQLFGQNRCNDSCGEHWFPSAILSCRYGILCPLHSVSRCLR